MMKNKLQIGKDILAVTAKEVTGSLIAANLYSLGLFQQIRSNNSTSNTSYSLKNNQIAKPSSPVHTRPVLLVHGIAHNASAFIQMKTKMQKRGWLHVFTMNYSTLNTKLIEMVGELSCQVDKVMEVTGASQIDIVAHSLGGIVSRYYMAKMGQGKVKNLVTLGAPHKGTYLSPLLKTFAFNKNLSSDLYIDSPFLKKLRQKIISKNSTITSIYSKYDWTVWPQDNCFVEGSPSSAFKNIKLDFVSHISLLYSSRVFQHIVTALKS